MRGGIAVHLSIDTAARSGGDRREPAPSSVTPSGRIHCKARRCPCRPMWPASLTAPGFGDLAPRRTSALVTLYCILSVLVTYRARDPPFGTPPIVRRCSAAAFQNRVFGTRCDAGARAVRVWRSSSCRASSASLAASTSRASGAVELARLWPGQVSGPRRPGWGRRSRLRRRPRRSWRCAMSSGARRGLLYQAIGEKETQGGRS
jgi:hypothetical protein